MKYNDCLSIMVRNYRDKATDAKIPHKHHSNEVLWPLIEEADCGNDADENVDFFLSKLKELNEKHIK